MAQSVATSKQAVVYSVISFVSTRDLPKTACVSKVWKSATETTWNNSMPCPRSEVRRLFKASRAVRALLGKRDGLVSSLEHGLNTGCCTRYKKVTKFFIGFFLVGLLTTGILAVIDQDGHKRWPHWVVPLPLVASGVPLAFNICGFICILLSACPLLCQRWRVRQEVQRIGPLMDDRLQFENMASALTDSFRDDLELARERLSDSDRLDLQSFWKSATKLCPDDEVFFDVVTIPSWISGVFFLIGMPAMIELAPLYITLFCGSAYLLRYFFVGYALARDPSLVSAPTEAYGIAYFTVMTMLFGVGLLLLGLELDGHMSCPLAVATTFWVLILMLAISLIAGCANEDWCSTCLNALRTAGGLLAWAIVNASLGIGIGALLQKVTGGVLAVIPYSVIVFVFLTSLPFLGCAFTICAFYV